MKKFGHFGAGNNRVKEVAGLKGRILANSLTSSRVLLTPVFWYLHNRGAFLICFLVILWIDLSDILDGLVARMLNCQTVPGAILDAGADFAVLITLFSCYYVSGSYPLLVMILMVLSFGLFIFVNLLNKAFVKTRFGRYTGAVLYFGATLSIACRALYPTATIAANWIAIFLSVIILSVSIVENLIQFYRWRYPCNAK